MGGVMHRIALHSHNADQRAVSDGLTICACASHTHAVLLFLPPPRSPFSILNGEQEKKEAEDVAIWVNGLKGEMS